MTNPMVLVATWRDGLFIVAGETLDQELVNQSVRALAPDGGGGALAIVNGRLLRRRAPDGRGGALAMLTPPALSGRRMEHDRDRGVGSRVLRGGWRRHLCRE